MEGRGGCVLRGRRPGLERPGDPSHRPQASGVRPDEAARPVTVVRSWLYSGRRLFLGAAVLAVAIGLLLGLGIAANRFAHHVTGVIEVTAIVVVGAIVLGMVARALRPGLPPGTVLELDIARLPPEAVGQNPLAQARGRRQLSMRETVELLERAATDRRGSGLLGYTTFDRRGIGPNHEP